MPNYTMPPHVPYTRSGPIMSHAPHESVGCLFNNDQVPMKSFVPQNFCNEPKTRYCCSGDYYCPTPVRSAPWPRVSVNDTERFMTGCNLRNDMAPKNNFCCQPFGDSNNNGANVYYCQLPVEPTFQKKNVTEEFLNSLQEDIKMEKPVIKRISFEEMDKILNKHSQNNKCSFLCPSELIKIFKSTIDLNTSEESTAEDETDSESDSETDTLNEIENLCESENASIMGSESETDSFTDEEASDDSQDVEDLLSFKNDIAEALKKMVKSEVDVKTININLDNNTSLEALGTELKNAITNSLKNLMQLDDTKQ